MLFLQKTHPVPRTLNIRGRHPTPTRETRRHSKNACTKNTQGSETISRFSWLLPQIRSKIRRHFQSTDTADKKRCRFQLDKGMPRVFPDTERGTTESPHPQVPQPTGKLHSVHRRLEVCICWSLNSNMRGHRPPYCICKWTIQRITIKLGSSDKGSLCYLHVSKETEFLHRHCQGHGQK